MGAVTVVDAGSGLNQRGSGYYQCGQTRLVSYRCAGVVYGDNIRVGAHV